MTLRQDMNVIAVYRRIDQDVEKCFKLHVVMNAHVLHGQGWFFYFDNFVVISSNQTIKGIADKAETKVAASIFASCA